MNTYYLFLLIAVYMIGNLITDIKTLKTKNFWHLLFLLVYFIIGGIVFKNVLLLFVSMLLGFLMGCIMSKLPHSTLGAGDIKMLIVVTVFEQLIKINSNPLLVVSIVFSIYIVVSFVHMSIYKTVWILTKGKVKFHSYSISNREVITPEAVPIFLTVILINISIINVA
ncbi:hypothetical protein [Rhodococcus sp. 15-2388-1-1a]|uniref:hypothetical protein n=1 Tax=Rhodococcus sp. 15-2388-1-1a TaxID=2023142 RepID=UPI00113FCE2C|nr:hypothetical protein [Rhodococcus sp. 15-2388-1-1a]